MSAKKFADKYLAPGVSFVDEDLHRDFLVEKYPEDEERLEERTESVVDDLLEEYGTATATVLHIIVGHKEPIDMLNFALGGKEGRKFKDCDCSVMAISPGE